MQMTEIEFLVLDELLATGINHPYAVGRSLESRGAQRTVSLGALYKALHRLEAQGLVKSDWEQIDPAAYKRPRRRLYRLTVVGERTLKLEAIQRVALLQRALASGA